MGNKVLIRLIFPELDESFDIFVPVNEIIWKIKKMMIKSVKDLSGSKININCEYILLNKDNLRIYNNNEIVINTDIRNGTEIIVLSDNS